jgi:hypothetical protein
MKEKQLGKKKRLEKKRSGKDAKREYRVAFMLNRAEYHAIERHLSKYGIRNKSNWYRSTILAQVWKRMEEDYPMLFHEKEMRR